MIQRKSDSATFVTGCGRSGTTLMLALLDNHPELLAFPEECIHLHFSEEILGEDGNTLDFLFRDTTLIRLQGDANRPGKYLDQRNYNSFDYSFFKEEVDKRFKKFREKKSDKMFLPALALLSLIDGYGTAIGAGQYSRWVVKHPKYELYWPQLFNDFPKAKVIFMLRDPREQILSKMLLSSAKRESQQRGGVEKWSPEMRNLRPPINYLKKWERSVIEFSKIRQAFSKQILLVRFEDLLSNTEWVMQEISDFLNLSWHENLLNPTFLGMPWKGNSSQQRNYKGVNSSKSKKKYKLSPHHLWQIEAWMGQTMSEQPARYLPSGVLEKLDVKALISRLPGENILTFFRNRYRMMLNRHQFLHYWPEDNKSSADRK
jgi:hypothetical protein